MDSLATYEQAFIRAVGARVRQLREQKGLTLQEVASYTSRTPEWLGGLERGVNEPTLDDLFYIAKALGTDTSDLVRVEVEA